MTNKMFLSAISPAKANRLYWLGRYSERVCTALHILRKYYDAIIDHEDTDAPSVFCSKMGIPCEYSQNSREWVHKYLYSTELSYSVINMLERVKDNAILLREELKSESLQYIELAINYMKEAGEKDLKLYDIQFITDTMYSFWGAAEDRIYNSKVRDLITTGKCIEKLDLYIRFEYEADRIEDIVTRLERLDAFDSVLYNEEDLENFKKNLETSDYNTYDALCVVNSLFAA